MFGFGQFQAASRLNERAPAGRCFKRHRNPIRRRRRKSTALRVDGDRTFRVHVHGGAVVDDLVGDDPGREVVGDSVGAPRQGDGRLSPLADEEDVRATGASMLDRLSSTPSMPGT